MSRLSDWIEPATTVVTVNRRLARLLRERFAAERAGAARAWESPDILPYGAWLERLWDALCEQREADVPALLGAGQELALWEQVVEAHGGGESDVGLLQSAAAARAARDAWSLLRAWRLDLERVLGEARTGGRVGEDTLVFAAWARAYRERCRDGGWTDRATLPDRLMGEAVGVLAPELGDLVLAGFDTLTPQQRALFDALAGSGVSVRSLPPPRREARTVRTSFAVDEEELHASARWARKRVEQGDAGLVGVVVPELQGMRERVERIFLDVLHPGHARPGADPGERAFNVSLGRPLSGIALAADALLALGALRGRLSLDELGRCLLSPYLDLGELARRARLDAALRRVGEPEWPLAMLSPLIPRLVGDVPEPGAGRAADVAPLELAIERVRTRIAALPRRQAAAQWAGTFSSALADLGWPGSRALDSDEFQTFEAVQDLLAELAALGPVLPDLGLGEALTQLQRLAARHVFQSQTPPAPVQVLGVLEASGIEYSALWITGLHDDAWPQPPRPNPFLPLRLQREQGMPRASAAQQLEWAGTWTTRMLASASEVVVSHARQAGEEPLRTSALVAHIEEVDADALGVTARPGPRASGESAAMHAEAPALERIDDQHAPRLAAHAEVRGGVSVLSDQSACPFRAFALHRLGAADVAVPSSSVDARVRGTVAHRLLELLWRRIESHERLLAHSRAEREALVDEVVGRVLGETSRTRPLTLRGRLLVLERARLAELAHGWLELEATRAPFRVTPEHSGEARLGGLVLRVRPDRVDRMSDGALVVVDYKTGHGSPSQWVGERPDEPQLPFYATALEDRGGERVAGIAFALLHPGKLRFVGIADEDGLAPGVTALARAKRDIGREAADWPGLMALWRSRLESLARAFAAGDARVDPKRPGATCRSCGLQPLCRVHSLELEQVETS